MVNFDMTFCCRDCSNMDCIRNIKHLEDIEGRKIYSVANFTDCKDYKQTISKADKYFIELGYTKIENGEYILYEKADDIYHKTIAFQRANRHFHCRNEFGEFETITPKELEAMYEKYKEMNGG